MASKLVEHVSTFLQVLILINSYKKITL